MEKGKALKIVSIVFLALCAALTFASMIIGFVLFVYNGILPLFIFILLIVTIVLSAVSSCKKRLAISPLILMCFIIPLIVTSMFFMSVIVIIDLISCLFIFGSIGFYLCYLLLNAKDGQETKTTMTKENKTVKSTSNYENMISQLSGLKDLLDAGILSEQEFNDEKAKLFNENKIEISVTPKNLIGEYICENMQINIDGDVFELKLNGKVVKVGDVKISDVEVILISNDNKKMTLKRRGDDLVSLQGAVYKKQ